MYEIKNRALFYSVFIKIHS